MITSDTNFRGNFDSIEAVWEAIPYGGVEGDYLNIRGVKYRWNKYLAMWENAEVVTETPARETVTFDEDVNMQNDLTVAGVLRAKEIVAERFRAWNPKGNYDATKVYSINDLVYDTNTKAAYLSMRSNNIGHPVDENDESYEEGWWMEVQTIGVPKGDFSLSSSYNVGDIVYDSDTNSSYLSLRADNTGHPVDENDEEYEEGWWMKVLDGSYVNVLEEELQQLVDSISEGTQQQVEELNEALEALEAQADQSRQDIQDIVDSLAVVQTMGQSASDVMSQKAVTDIVVPIDKKITGAEAEYYEPITVTYVQGSTKNADGTIESTSTKNITTQFLDLTGVSEIVFCVDNPPTGLSNLYLKSTWYNSSKGFISVGSWTSNKTITIPNNVSFLRISLSVYVNGSQIDLTPSVAQTYGFRVEPYQMDRWYGLLGKTEALKTDLDAAEEDIDIVEKEIYSEEPEERIIDGSTLVSCGGTINISTNKWQAATEYYGSLINCVNFRGMTCILTKDTSLSTNMGYAFVTSGFSNGNTPNYATGYSRVLYTSSDVRTVVPNDAVYLFVQLRSTIYSLAPKTIQLGLRGLKERVEDLEEIVDSIGSSSGFRIASYNIGHFSHGAYTDSTITSSDYDTKLAAYRQLIYGKIDADVIGLCEYSAIFGNNGTTNTSAKDVLFNRYEFDYIGEQIRYSCNAVYSNLFVENLSKKTFDCNQDVDITHTNLAEASDFYYIEGDLWFNGVMIKLVMTHLAFDNNNPQVALNQINELITKFDSYNRVIMMGDWNTGISGQSAFVTAGYTLGNDGSFLTYSDTVAQYALDNIIVKGVNISKFGMIHTTGLSDHLPVYATIMV